jgi:hypothetical protein
MHFPRAGRARVRGDRSSIEGELEEGYPPFPEGLPLCVPVQTIRHGRNGGRSLIRKEMTEGKAAPCHRGAAKPHLLPDRGKSFGPADRDAIIQRTCG